MKTTDIHIRNLAILENALLGIANLATINTEVETSKIGSFEKTEIVSTVQLDDYVTLIHLDVDQVYAISYKCTKNKVKFASLASYSYSRSPEAVLKTIIMSIVNDKQVKQF